MQKKHKEKISVLKKAYLFSANKRLDMKVRRQQATILKLKAQLQNINKEKRNERKQCQNGKKI